MNANCVNVLNKTVSNVCRLDEVVKNNVEDIEFLFKYCNFNKNLLLSMLGCKVEIDTFVYQYDISNAFATNYLLEYLLYSVINYLNANVKENYYILVRCENDIPSPWKKCDISIPSVLEIGLVQPNKNDIIEIFDSIKTNTFIEFQPVVSWMNLKFGKKDVYSLVIAVLYYLVAMPILAYNKEYSLEIKGKNICQAYENLQESNAREFNDLRRLVNKYSNLELNVTTVIDTVKVYIKKGYEAALEDYKLRSVNDPYLPKPTIHQIYVAALDLFLEDNHLKITGNGDVIQYGNDGPAEPFAPAEPDAPYDLLAFNNGVRDFELNLENYIDLDTQSGGDSGEGMESKIKRLLELTETDSYSEN